VPREPVGLGVGRPRDGKEQTLLPEDLAPAGPAGSEALDAQDATVPSEIAADVKTDNRLARFDSGAAPSQASLLLRLRWLPAGKVALRLGLGLRLFFPDPRLFGLPRSLLDRVLRFPGQQPPDLSDESHELTVQALPTWH
jgi:hypothetical protein